MVAIIKSEQQYKLTDQFVFELPSQGSKYDTCSKFISKGHFDTDSGQIHHQKFFNDCGRFECPVCDGWRSAESMSIFDRLSTFKETAKRSIIHYVVSPKPREINSPSEYKKLRSRMYKIARKHGIRGGVAIFHYFRHPSELNDREEIEPHNPHWHILGDGWVRPSEYPDWIVKNLRIRRSSAQLMSTIKYCLKWASKGILLIGDSSSQKIEIETWFGDMSLKALKVAKFSGDGVKCETCEQMIPYKQWYIIEFWDQDHVPDPGIFDPKDGRIVLPYEEYNY